MHFWLVSAPLIQCLENKLFLISTVQSILKKSTLNIHWKGWCWSWSSNDLATWSEEPTHWKRPWCLEKWRQEEKRATEDEMVGWYHRLNGHEFEQALGDSEGQGGLACCSPWGPKELDTERLNNKNKRGLSFFPPFSFLPSFFPWLKIATDVYYCS